MRAVFSAAPDDAAVPLALFAAGGALLPIRSSAGLSLRARSAAAPCPCTCMQKMRGSSQKKWLCRAVTSKPFSRSADMTGLTSS
jgi:hypothetical protein